MGLRFEVVVGQIDERSLESQMAGWAPDELTRKLAVAKAEAVRAMKPEAIVIGADTVVALGSTILSKPKSARDALDMLRQLRGKTHDVVTSVAVLDRRSTYISTVSARVTMRESSNLVLKAYIETGEPMDKAGAYGVQGLGGDLVDWVDGCYLTVVGLPICLLGAMLMHVGVLARTVPEELCVAQTRGLRRASGRIQLGHQVSAHPDISPFECFMNPA